MLECHEGECADVERRRPHFVHVRLGTQVVRGFFVNATVEAPPRWSALLGVVFGLHTVADGVEMNVWQRAVRGAFAIFSYSPYCSKRRTAIAS